MLLKRKTSSDTRVSGSVEVFKREEIEPDSFNRTFAYLSRGHELLSKFSFSRLSQ
jgi:hypothetical protein